VKLYSSLETYRRFGRIYNLCPGGRGSLFLRNYCTGLLCRLHSATYQRAIIFISPLREPQILSFMQNSNFGIRLTHLLCFLRHLTGVRLKDVSRFRNILRFWKKMLGQRDVMCKLKRVLLCTWIKLGQNDPILTFLSLIMYVWRRINSIRCHGNLTTKPQHQQLWSILYS
jgi:hypothetical protein